MRRDSYDLIYGNDLFLDFDDFSIDAAALDLWQK